MENGIVEIKSIASEVFETLGSGFPEAVYDRAMQVGLRLANFRYDSQKVVELKYKNHYVGEGYPDLVVHLADESSVIVELKALCSIGRPEEQQLRNYMRLLDCEKGLLINFQQPDKAKTQKNIAVDIRELH
jgi:GxxExxY protein